MNPEERLKPISAVIFDMDGLVLDTESTYFVAWQQAAARMGFHLSDEYCLTLSGLQYQDVLRQVKNYCGNNFKQNEFDQLSALCWREHVTTHGIAVKKGFFKVLRIIQEKKWPFCLATNSFTDSARECLRYAGLEFTFPLLVGRDAVTRGKPSPDIFFYAAQMLATPVLSCLIIEDSPTGILAASETSAQTVYIPSILPPDPQSCERADFVFPDLLRLGEFLQLADFDHV